MHGAAVHVYVTPFNFNCSGPSATVARGHATCAPGPSKRNTEMIRDHAKGGSFAQRPSGGACCDLNNALACASLLVAPRVTTGVCGAVALLVGMSWHEIEVSLDGALRCASPARACIHVGHESGNATPSS
eukprot:365817-Chlamydomonas_euryale.AAC.31